MPFLYLIIMGFNNLEPCGYRNTTMRRLLARVETRGPPAFGLAPVPTTALRQVIIKSIFYSKNSSVVSAECSTLVDSLSFSSSCSVLIVKSKCFGGVGSMVRSPNPKCVFNTK